jgi:hypothetical protein
MVSTVVHLAYPITNRLPYIYVSFIFIIVWGSVHTFRKVFIFEGKTQNVMV